MGARAKYPGPWFPAMGNHECNGYTASNCGSGNTDGLTDNYIRVWNDAAAPLWNQFSTVELTALTAGGMLGRLVAADRAVV